MIDDLFEVLVASRSVTKNICALDNSNTNKLENGCGY